jgi:hypothetical protein
MALKKDCTVLMWGGDNFSPTHGPEGLSNVVSLAGGGSDYGRHCLAIRSDGTIVGWGYDSYGWTVPPGNFTNISAVASGTTHTLALT